MTIETGYSRKFPSSKDGIKTALQTALEEQLKLVAQDMRMIPAVSNRLISIVPKYVDALDLETTTNAASTKNVGLKSPLFDTAQMIANHYIQGLNLGIRRSVFSKEDHAYYDLPIEGFDLPYLGSEAAVLEWGDRIVKGDAARVAAGGVPMSMPTALEVKTAIALLRNSVALQKVLDKNVKDAEAATLLLMPEAIEVMKLVWDAIESFYSNKIPATKRSLCRVWGMIFVTGAEQAILTGLCADASGKGKGGVTVTNEKTGGTAITNDDGRYEIDTDYIGTSNLLYDFPGETQQKQPYTSIAGETTEMKEIVI